LTRSNNVAALAALKEGLLLVGEGVSFKDYPDLPEVPDPGRSKRGLPVLVPGAGGPAALPVPGRRPRQGAATASREPGAGGANHITPHWTPRPGRSGPGPPDGKVGGQHGDPEGGRWRRGRPWVRPAAPVDWPWLEVEFPARKGRLVVCGFRPVRQGPWDGWPGSRATLFRPPAGNPDREDRRP